VLAPRGAVVVAAVLVGLSVARFAAPHYTVEPLYTDHLHHEYAAWAFLHIGFGIFDTPLDQWAVHAKHVHVSWDWAQQPMLYPPGLVLFFVPFGVASNESLLPDARIHMVMVMVLAAAAVLASFQLLRTLRLAYEPVLTAILSFLGTILFVTWGLNGFIDPLAAGLALAGIYWSECGRRGRGLMALVAALSLQFRLWYLWPFVIALIVEHRREIRRWQLAVTGFVAAISTAAFILSVPFLGTLAHAPGFEPNALALAHGWTVERSVAFVAGAAVLVITLAYDRLVAGACVGLALALIFYVDQWQAWYPILFFPLLAVVRARPAQIAVMLASVEAVFYLGGFPNLMRSVHLYIDAVR
jgi:hypothetical protein